LATRLKIRVSAVRFHRWASTESKSYGQLSSCLFYLYPHRVPTIVDFLVKISSVASLMACLLASVPVRIAQPQQAVSAKTVRNVWPVTALPE
jgi:hypothetical protein